MTFLFFLLFWLNFLYIHHTINSKIIAETFFVSLIGLNEFNFNKAKHTHKEKIKQPVNCQRKKKTLKLKKIYNENSIDEENQRIL